MSDLSGKKALVTGAGMGIGQGIAVDLARRGAEVAVHYAHTEPYDTVARVERLGGKAAAVWGDLSKVSDCERTVDAAAEAVVPEAEDEPYYGPKPQAGQSVLIGPPTGRLPLPGAVTSTFSGHKARGSAGVDIDGKMGDPIEAPAGGKVSVGKDKRTDLTRVREAQKILFHQSARV